MLQYCFDGVYYEEFRYQHTAYPLIPTIEAFFDNAIDTSQLSPPWVYRSKNNDDICLLSWEYDGNQIVQKMKIEEFNNIYKGRYIYTCLICLYIDLSIQYLGNTLVKIKDKEPDHGTLISYYPEYWYNSYEIVKTLTGYPPSCYLNSVPKAQRKRAVGFLFMPMYHGHFVVIIWQTGKSKVCEVERRLPSVVARAIADGKRFKVKEGKLI